MKGADRAVARIRAVKEEMRLSDQGLATLVGVNQSSVHRALTSPRPAWTPTMQKLWAYAKTRERRRPAEGSADELDALRGLLRDASGGTLEGLERLAQIIRVVAEIRRAAMRPELP